MRLTWFGPNMGYPPFDSIDPAVVGRAGFNCVVLNLTDHPSLPNYVLRCKAAGMAVVGRVVSGSLDRFPNPRTAARYYARMGPSVVTLGNEIDGHPDVNNDGSWFQSQAEWAAMRVPFVEEFEGVCSLYGPGTVTDTVPGEADELDLFPLQGLTGLDNHSYAQWPNTIMGLFGRFDRFDAQYGFTGRFCSEFGWPDADPAARGQYIVDMVRAVETGNEARIAAGKTPIVAMLPYCWDRDQHSAPFYLNHPRAIERIQMLGYGPGVVPPIIVPGDGDIGQGFRTWQAREPDLLGDFDEPIEWGPVLNFSQIKTTQGLLSWVDPKEAEATLTYYDWTTGDRYVWRESWPASQRVTRT